MKKFFAVLTSLIMISATFCGCVKDGVDKTGDDNNDPVTPPVIETPPVTDWFDELPENTKQLLSADGYVKGNISDFSQYVGTDAYRTVATADELITAIVDAKYHYDNNWDEATETYTQTPAQGYTQENFVGKVHVIEITQDLNLGYNVLSETAKGSGIVDNYASKYSSLKDWLYWSDMFLENGISQIKVENTSDLLIYSKNGAKITHAGFKLTSDTNVVFRNLQFDELWQWEDAPSKDSSKIGDYDWFGWAYFKIAFCGYIWIDHCTFGKSYDGQIDYSNPVYNANAATAFRAPYGALGENGLHISWCKFNAGSDEENGYLYKMMKKIEDDYLNGESNCLYYKALRDGGASFEEILYGIAIPQKKGFLCGDDATYDASKGGKDDYTYNLSLNVSFSNCIFINLEDRLPKLRGGNAYMYNCLVDSSQYYVYRTTLKSKNAANLVQTVNSGWKCGLVSQGIVCGNGGSVKAENCIYRGIEYLLKNNDTKNSGTYVEGGYQLINCSYQKRSTDSVYIGSSDDSSSMFTNDTPAKLKCDSFSWHTADGQQPFTVKDMRVGAVEIMLADENYGAGISTALQNRLLNGKY